ncbi:UvrD-helicase domain-containing protein [Sunxiuqinia sp. A32]|uniref:UvrD-helicase domain-containing protein n=1 Tax=Sunxiuqinia sp. A32 TaxID=3461496 RepID=UPI0040461F44
MSQLQVYKASAGSGKTFRLAVEYLKIILSGEWNYKNVLAVTFTNKATAEMKQRVVQELYELANGKKTAYLDVLVDELNLQEMEIANRAKKSLKHILHDYSRFSVSTIDSFFQRVIKAFNRELGINTAYQVDLEEDLILEEAVDQLLLSIDENPDLLEWLKQFARDKILEGDGWNLKRDILNLGRQIYNETFKDQNEQLYQKLNDRVFIRNYRRELQQIIFQFENKLKHLGQAGLNVMSNAGLTVADFKYGKSGAANTFNILLQGQFKIGARLLAVVEDVGNLYKQPDKNSVEPTALKLHPLLVEAVDFYQKKLSEYNTAKLINKQLYTLAILVDLQSTMRKLVREKGVILISESGYLLKEIISDADAPFIYEKTGVFYNHFMIDEFQDTSGLQWNNFLPLINNSLSEDNFSLLVGDVKQAIYRWRNGDWRLLAGKINDHFPFNGVNDQVLDKNWRSDGNIIRFNNRIFQVVPEVMDNHFAGETEQAFEDDTEFPTFENIYKESIQKIGKAELADKGFVQMRFLVKEKDLADATDEKVLGELIDTIKGVQSKGARANEIAILVRKKDEAKIIADRLLEEKKLADSSFNFNVLSSESLYVKSSSLVSFLIALLELVLTPEDDLLIATANYLFYNDIQPLVKKVGFEPNFSSYTSEGQLEMLFKEVYQPTNDEQFEEAKSEENEFTTFLKSDFYQEELSFRNVQEVIFRLCDIFNLFELKDEQAYLQAFIDQVGGFMKSKSAGLSSFLEWWNVQGQKKTIAVSEDFDAIRIQTIHKAKGLEYKYVMIPFCDWQIGISSAQHAPIIWCKPTTEPFKQLELVPVKYEASMADSEFKREYFEEKISSYIDSLNMLYVAFTRARSVLYTWSVYTGKMNTVGDLLRHSVTVEGGGSTMVSGLDVNLVENFDEENELFQYGELSIESDQRNENDGGIFLDEFRFTDFNKFLHLKKRNENFFIEQKDYEVKINLGKIIHEVLAKIRNTEELPFAVKELILQGVVSEKQGEEIRNQLETMIKDPAINHWFDGSFEVVNERSILTGQKGIKRPDRIMIGESETIVVDYKSGDTELEKYTYQLRSYIRALKACGFKNVSGCIWYTKSNKRVKIDG